jgi:hypothetical protein
MSAQDTVKSQKRRGPPATGKGEPILVRVQPELLAAVDTWIAERRASIADPQALSRPEALRQLAAEALKTMGLLKP